MITTENAWAILTSTMDDIILEYHQAIDGTTRNTTGAHQVQDQMLGRTEILHKYQTASLAIDKMHQAFNPTPTPSLMAQWGMSEMGHQELQMVLLELHITMNALAEASVAYGTMASRLDGPRHYYRDMTSHLLTVAKWHHTLIMSTPSARSQALMAHHTLCDIVSERAKTILPIVESLGVNYHSNIIELSLIFEDLIPLMSQSETSGFITYHHLGQMVYTVRDVELMSRAICHIRYLPDVDTASYVLHTLLDFS